LVDHPHRVQRTRVDDPLRILFAAPCLVQRLRNLPRRRNIRKDNIARIAEQQVIQLETIAELAADVKFHAGVSFTGKEKSAPVSSVRTRTLTRVKRNRPDEMPLRPA